jgi:gliding motility-associated-like protein
MRLLNFEKCFIGSLKVLKSFLLVFTLLFAATLDIKAQCDINNPYDKIISTFHSSIALKSDGSYAVWGQLMNKNGTSDLLTPQDLNSTNYTGLTGTVLKATLGGFVNTGNTLSGTYYTQGIVLTTTGLFAWGTEGSVLSTNLTTSSTFQKITTPTGGDVNTGLPSGVNPSDVSMMIAADRTFVILTTSGNVWILSLVSNEITANGLTGTPSSTQAKTWYKAKTASGVDLTDVKAVRLQVSNVNYNAIMALTNSGSIYTWGKTTYLGNNTSVTSKNYATLMTLPSEFTISNIPKMIAVTGGSGYDPDENAGVKNTLYVLSNSGALYALGDNSNKQIGDFTTTERLSWVNSERVNGTNFSNVNSISVQEHDGSWPGVAIVTKTGDLYTWGNNNGLMIGRNDGSLKYDPGFPNGFTSGTDKALSVEMGGHTTVYLKEGTTQFCYVGHKVSGSMGDGSNANTNESTFNCTGTPSLSICGSVPVAGSTTTSTITANPTSIVGNGTSTTTVTVQLKQTNGTNLTSTGGTVVMTTNKGTISSVTDNNNGTYTAILTSSTLVETATLNYSLNGTDGTNTATVNFTVFTNPSITTTGTLKTFSTCSGCTVSPQTFTVSGSDLSTNNIVITAPSGFQVSTNSTTGFATSVSLTPSSGTITTTTIYAKLTNNATSTASGVISVTSTGATSKTITVTTNTDNALNFDGTNDYVTIPDNNSLDLSSNFTLETWIYPSSNTGSQVLIGKIDETSGNSSALAYALRFNSGNLTFEVGNGSTSRNITSANLELNKWQHIAGVFENGSLKLYINGVSQATGTASFTSVQATTSSLKLGAYAGTYGQYFNGSLDEVRLWNIVKTQSEISASINSKISGSETGLVAYYDFDNGTANGTNSGLTTLSNRSNTASINGTLTNFALSGTTSNYVVGSIPPITATGSITSLSVGATLQLSNALTGGTWSSSNTALATVNTSGLVTGVTSGTVTITYTICEKVVSYALNIVQPTITTSGTLKTFTSCSGCTVTPQNFSLSGYNLSSSIELTAPTGIVISNAISGTYSSSLSLTQSAGTVTTTTVYVKLSNNATSASSGVISITSTGAASKSITATVNTDNALKFDGTNDYVSLASGIGTAYNNTAVTLEAWIRTNAPLSDIDEIISWGHTTATNNVVEFRISQGKLQFILNDGIKFYALTSTNLINTGKWVHVAVVKSGSTVNLYINGQIATTETPSGDVTSNPNLNLANIGVLQYKPSGAFAIQANSYFPGDIDQVRVWNIAKSSSDILNDMFVEMMGNETGIVANYDFNQGIANGNNSSVTSLTDKTSNAYDGTFSGFSLSGTTSNFVDGFIPSISAAGNAITVAGGSTLSLSNSLSGGTWSSSTNSIATVNSNTGLVTGVAAGNLTVTYTICGKTTSYALTVTVPTITTTGTIPVIATCSGCNVNPNSFTVSGTDLNSNIILTAPTGIVMSTSSNGTYSTTISLTPSSGTVTNTSIFVKLTNNATTNSSGSINITSTGAVSKTMSVTVNTDNALNFDGVNDAINIGQPIAGGSSFTMEAWINYKGSLTENNIISSSSNVFWIYQDKLNGGIANSYQIVTSPDALEKNKWYHVALVFDDPANLMKLYVNGSLVASTTTNLSFTGSQNSYIGSHFAGSPVSFFKGNIDEVRIWNIVRSESEILASMNSELSSNESGLVSYYNFNQGVINGTNTGISTLTDKKARINGSLSAFALTGTTSNFVPGYISSITGTATANVGGSSTLSNTLTGGIWTSANTAVASVNSSTGAVTGVAAGTSTITYTICDKTVNTLFTVTVPTITTTGTLTAFSTCATTNSTAQTFTVSAQYLTANLVLTAPTGYEIALSSGGTYSSTISIAPSSGTVSARLIYVRTTTSAVNGQSGNIAIASTGATTKNIATGNAVITQNKTASLTITSNATNETICSGSSITFTTNATNGGSTPTYQWQLNGSNISGATGSTYTTSALSSNSTITAVMTSNIASCLSGSPATSNAINVIVNSVPSNPGAISGLTTICMNSNQVFSIPAVSGATSYTWVVTGSLSASATSTTNVINITAANAAGSGTLTVYANNTCGTSVSNSTLAVNVNNTPAPTASFTVSANNLCLSNAGITFTNTSTPNATTSASITSFSWDYADGNTYSSTSSASVSHTYTNTGNFDAILTIQDGNSCTSSIASRIIVDPISVAGTATAANSTICEGTSTTLSLTGSIGNIQWQSSIDGVNYTNISGATTSSYTTPNLTSTTYYKVVVTSGVCSSATSGSLTVTVNPTPTATISNITGLFNSSTSFDLVYSSALGNPNEYSISSASPNAMPGFTSVNNYGLLGSPIIVSIPASSSGVYNFNLLLANNTLGCSSSAIPFTVTISIAAPSSLSYTTPNVYTVGTGITALNPTSTGGAIASYAVSPSLPTGLTINPTTGVISGTPTTASNQSSYIVTGTNASGTVTATVIITVNVAAPASLSYTTPNVYTVGTAINALNPTFTGGPINTYSVSPNLPSGLTLNTSTGIINGTPSSSALQASYIITGTNATGSVSATLVLTVNSGIVPQPQGSLNAVDYGLLSKDTVKLKLTITNGNAPFTLILSNSANSIKDTISNLTPINNEIEFLHKRLDTSKIFTIFKLIDANNNTRTVGFTKDTTIVRLLKPQILLTLKADPAMKQADNSYKTRLLLKIKNAGQLNLRNVQVNANLSKVFPSNITYILDSVRVLSGGLILNQNYNGAGSATSISSADLIANASTNNSKSSLAVLDGNYLFNNGVSLNQSQEGEVAYYVSIGATSQNIILKLQFGTAGDGVLLKNDGIISTQATTSISDDGTNINQHPDLTNNGSPLPTYVPLFPNEKIGASLNVGSAIPVSGGFKYHFTAKVKNYGNVNLDSLRIQYNFNDIFPSPDQASLIGVPTVTRGNIIYNANNFNGYSNINLFDYGGGLQVGDSATYEYDLLVSTSRVAFTWQNYFVAYGRSVNSGLFVNDTSMAGIDPDPNNDNDPIEKFFSEVTINFNKPISPTVENKIYTYGQAKPANIGGLVKSTPSGSVPVWCDTRTAACVLIPPSTPSEIGRYIFALRSYDTTTFLYSEVLVYDTVVIRPPVPIVLNKKYIIGASSNPNNISGQVTGMTGSTLKYFKNGIVLNSIPSLGIVPGVIRYTTSQIVNAIESDTVGFTVTMLDPKTMLYLQKIADEPILQSNSTFNITYTFLVNNRTDESMSNVLVVDNLQNTFPLPTVFTKVSLISTGSLTVNNGFNGTNDINLLNGSSSLAALATDTIRLIINLQPKGYNGTVNNVAVVTATTPYGVINMNSSSQSFSTEGDKTPTPSVIPDLTIDIPEAFSPNRDGVNDRFIILKPFGTTLDLEVYNRWGNVVYSNSNYNNEWDGRGTNNFIGQDLMDGGYYYTLKAKSVNGNSQIFKGFVLIQR